MSPENRGVSKGRKERDGDHSDLATAMAQREWLLRANTYLFEAALDASASSRLSKENLPLAAVAYSQALQTVTMRTLSNARAWVHWSHWRHLWTASSFRRAFSHFVRHWLQRADFPPSRLRLSLIRLEHDYAAHGR